MPPHWVCSLKVSSRCGIVGDGVGGDGSFGDGGGNSSGIAIRLTVPRLGIGQSHLIGSRICQREVFPLMAVLGNHKGCPYC